MRNVAEKIKENFENLDDRIMEVEKQMMSSKLNLDLVLPPPPITSNKRPGESLFPLNIKRSKTEEREVFTCSICVLDGGEKEFTSAGGVQNHLEF